MKQLSILGSTGSIGRQCLSVVESLPGRFGVVALAAGANLEELVGQIERHQPEVVSVADAQRADDLSQLLGEKGLTRKPDIHHGREGMLAVATHPKAEIVMSAAVGVVGLEATYEAVKLGKTVALSNKEVLVAAGELVMTAARKAGRELLPVDSEHNALHQCLRGGTQSEVRRLVLTASGGPFRKTPLAQLANVTPEQALAHPNWRMGNRITIDSATMMNKGFEVIEAHWLFDVRADQIEVVVHPQSTIHSMVEFIDGSILAQLAPPDMRMPIQYALTYPERVASKSQVALDWSKPNRLASNSQVALDWSKPNRLASNSQVALDWSKPNRLASKSQVALDWSKPNRLASNSQVASDWSKPNRLASNSQAALDWSKLKRLDFEKASTRRFPCLRLAREAMSKGGAYPCALNAADEIAVSAFLERRLPFLGIPEVIERVLERTPRVRLDRMEDVLTADAEARRMAQEEVAKLSGGVAAQVHSA